MASVAASSSSHYIRTVQTTFTSQLTRSATPEARRPHQPLSSTLSSASNGHRRRAYSSRAVESRQHTSPAPGRSSTYGFEDEPTAPVPTLKSVSQPSPRLAHAWLPPYSHHVSEQSKRFAGAPPGLTAKRQADALEPLPLIGANGDMWRGFSPKPRGGSKYDLPPPPLPSSTSQASLPSSTASTPPELAAPIGRRGAVPSYAQLSRPRLTRTPSPPASPAPGPSFSSTRQALQNDRNAKARLVAGILLNRAHGQKPRRGPIIVGSHKKNYIQSGLRNEVLVEA